MRYAQHIRKVRLASIHEGMGQQTAPDLSSRQIPDTRKHDVSVLPPSFDGISGHSKFQKTLPLRSPSKTLTSRARTIPSGTFEHEELRDTSCKRDSHHALPQEVIKDGFFVGSIDFNKFQISTTPIAEGSQAIVYQIKHQNSGMTYALKVLKAEIAQDPAERAAFEREINLLARLKHDHINGIVGIGVLPGKKSYCAMLELVETNLTDALKLNIVGKSLLTRTIVKSSWSNKDRFRICCEIASAINFLHSGSAIRNSVVVHRDLKPDNVGITSARRCLLLDFGLAVALRVESNVNCDDTYEMTGLTGSRRYMAPEVCRKQPYGIAVDVYSLALVVWEVLALKGTLLL